MSTSTTAVQLDTEFKRGTRAVRLDDGGRGLDDRVRDLPRLRRDGSSDRKPGSAAHGMGGHRRPHAGRRALVRRTGRDDAARRRAVRLPSRGVLAAVGFSLRLDALHGDPDWHDRRRRGRLRALHGLPPAVVRRGQLPHRADSPLVRLRRLALDGAAPRHRAHRAPDVDEHARARLGQADSGRLHDHEDGRADRAHRRRPARRVESAGGHRQLRRPVDRSRRGADCARPRCDDWPTGS